MPAAQRLSPESGANGQIDRAARIPTLPAVSTQGPKKLQRDADPDGRAPRQDLSWISKCERGERRLDIVEACSFCEAMGAAFAELTAQFHAKASTLR